MKKADYHYRKIAYLGIPGSYSYIAAQKYFKKKITMSSCDLFTEIFDSVTRNVVDAGILPLENSLTGSIYQTYDLLVTSRLNIIGEIILKIKQRLLVSEKLPFGKKNLLNKIKRCYSHPEAIKQCQTFFSKHRNIKPVFTKDTASAAKRLGETNSLRSCAIGSREAANIYHLRVVPLEIQDNPSNYTRFAIIAQRKKSEGNKVSLAFSIEHKPGSLFRTLEPYARLGLNLTKIESRPLFGKPWEYIFFVDLEIDSKETELRQVLEEMKEHVNFLKVLGRYEKGEIYET